MVGGTAYGVILNDRMERERLEETFTQPPYGKPPMAPVLYIKPRNTFAQSGTSVSAPGALAVGATIALSFGDDSGVPVAACLAIDLFLPHQSYYRPAIRERCRDGFLPLGRWAPWDPTLLEGDIVTSIDGAVTHRWNLSRLHRPPLDLMRDVGEFMTLSDGDLLLLGIAADAPLANPGQRIDVDLAGFPPLSVSLVEEPSA